MAEERSRQAPKGIVLDDAPAWAARNAAELVAFGATRAEKLGPRAWLSAASAMDGRPAREGDALVDAVLRRAGLSALEKTPIGSLAPPLAAALAIAETAIAIVGRDATVLVPEPPLPWPQRHETRRLAISMLGGARLVLHAREAWELAALVDPADITDGEGRSLGGAPETAPSRAIVLRTYANGEPYDAFRKALIEAGVRVEGGPIAHVLTVPPAFGVREVLAAASDAGVDVLEARDALA